MCLYNIHARALRNPPQKQSPFFHPFKQCRSNKLCNSHLFAVFMRQRSQWNKHIVCLNSFTTVKEMQYCNRLRYQKIISRAAAAASAKKIVLHLQKIARSLLALFSEEKRHAQNAIMEFTDATIPRKFINHCDLH